MTQTTLYTNKYGIDTEKVTATERDRYRALMFYFDICDSDEDIPVSRNEAVRLFRQIDTIKNPKLREELFGRLERYLGVFYDDEIKDWNAGRMRDDVEKAG